MATVIGVFNDRTETETAINALVSHGVHEDSIGVMWREQSVIKPEEVETATYVDHFDSPGEEAKKGAVGGALGGTAGVGGFLLASAGGLFIPEIGFFATAGTLSAIAAVAGGAVGGTVTGTLIGALLGATDHDATKVVTKETTYVEVLERHGFVVTIETDDEENAATALSEAGATDISSLDNEGRHRLEPDSD